MGKWAKSHKPSSRRLNPLKAAGDSWSALKDDMSPDMPGDTPEEKALRNRQAMDIAKLDEEENRRIKSMFSGGGGRKLFRSARSSSSARASAAASPGSGGASPSSAGNARPYSGFGGSRGSASLLP